jgi:hypothetical protein
VTGDMVGWGYLIFVVGAVVGYVLGRFVSRRERAAIDRLMSMLTRHAMGIE